MRQVVFSRRGAIAALVLPALVLVAIAARSYRPFGSGGGGDRGTSATVLDGTFTVLALLGILAALVGVWAWIQALRERPQGRRSQPPFASLAALLVVLVIAVVVGSDIVRKNDRPPRAQAPAGFAFPVQPVPKQPVPQLAEGRDPEFVWPLAIGLAVLIAAAIAAVVVIDRRRNRRGRGRPEQLEELARALDEALDDLRRDPDPRRAVIAAYARMEQALTLYGFPRRPSEAPYEYLSRVARDLEAEQLVAALTELFEVAKFSEHSVDETMRGRAIDALTAVRAEVRAEAT